MSTRRPLRVLASSATLLGEALAVLVILISLAVILIVAVLWTRSFWINDIVELRRPAISNTQHEWTISSIKGFLIVRRMTTIAPSNNDLPFPPPMQAYKARELTPQMTQMRLSIVDYCKFASLRQERHFPWEPKGYSARFGNPITPDMLPKGAEILQWFRIPYWYAIVPAMVPLLRPASRLIVRIRRKAGATQQCLHCGYDLRATPDRCPECGAVPAAQPARPGGAGG